MPLNIYTFSHPIIQLLTNSIINKEPNKSLYQFNYQYIGLLLMYEILRNHIETKILYVKYLNFTQDYHLIDSKKKLYILTDLSKTYQMTTKINILLPQIKIEHIDYQNLDMLNKTINKFNLNNNNNMFFILEKTLKSEKIMIIIKYLIKHTPLSLKNISICCTICSHEILNKLGKLYPSLQIYTTKIIYNTIK